jgi:pyruvate formate lyase activating enzyme
MSSQKRISKRDFIKYAALGSCGLAISASSLDLIAGKNGVFPMPEIPSGPEDPLWKWSKEALYYIDTPKGLKCKLCPRACEIKPNEVGECHTNLSYNGKLYSISYGNPCAVHIDPIEKKPLYHFLPTTQAFSIATAGCNLACLNCQNWEISQASPRDTRNYDLMPDQVVREAKNNQCKSIAYTYSDPVAFYEYTLDTSMLARQQGIKNLMISAGYINEDPLRRLLKFTDAGNIDLKSFDDSIYEMLNAGTLEPVLNTLKIFRDEGVWLEITNLIIPTWTDDFDMIKKMCDWLYDNDLHSYPLHFSRFSPLYKLTNLPQTPIATLEKARQIALTAGIKYVYIGNVPGHEGNHTYCPGCKKMLIERVGFSIKQNHITDSKCKFCGEKIDGVWEQ